MPVCFSAEWEELPEISGLYLARMGAFNGNVRMCVHGTEMDVSKTRVGVRALKYWKKDPVEIALYERGWRFLQTLPIKAICWCFGSTDLCVIAHQDAFTYRLDLSSCLSCRT